MPPDELDPDLLDRYLAGECSPAEAAALRAAAARIYGHPWALDAIRDAWTEDAGWAKVRQQMDASPADRVEHPDLSNRRADPGVFGARPRRPAAAWTAAWTAAWGGVAAAGVLAVLAVWQPWHRAAGVAAARDYVAPRGAAMTIRLDDSTRVILAADSRLRVPGDYGTSARVVSLEGEAYFDVRHDRSKPFTVRTALGVAEDLGTQFVVREYAGDSSVRVAVVRGRVAVRRPGVAGVQWVLTDRRAGELSAAADLVVRADVDLAPDTAWTDGRLVFADARVTTVAADLGRWYGVDVRVGDSVIGGRRFTGTFSRESVTEVLDAIALTADARWTRSGNVVTLLARTGR
jgi:transmembrane sensor